MLPGEHIADRRERRVSPMQAIRAKCLNCSGGRPREVRDCPVTDCALYPFRDGKNPNRRPPSEARRAAMQAAARKSHANRRKAAQGAAQDAGDACEVVAMLRAEQPSTLLPEQG